MPCYMNLLIGKRGAINARMPVTAFPTGVLPSMQDFRSS
jgi:hypothetical protein